MWFGTVTLVPLVQPSLSTYVNGAKFSLHGRKQYLYFRTNAQLCGFVLACRYPRPTLRIKNLRRQKIAFHSGKPYRPQERHCEMFVVLVVLNDWEVTMHPPVIIDSILSVLAAILSLFS